MVIGKTGLQYWFAYRGDQVLAATAGVVQVRLKYDIINVDTRLMFVFTWLGTSIYRMSRSP